jgi:hypothetical protein
MTEQTENQASVTPEQVAHKQLEQWVAKGLGGHPMVTTKEELEKLPELGRQEIAALFPEYYESLMADEAALPAATRLRLANKQLEFSDMQALTDAGFTAAVAFLEQRKIEYTKQALENFIEQQQQEMAAATEARQQEAERMRVEGEANFAAHQRANYLRYLQRTQAQDLPVNIESAVG